VPHVDVLVADELLDGVPQLLTLLEAREVSRKVDEAPGVTRLTVDMPYVPPGATAVEPVLQRVDGKVRVHSLAWTYTA
jgi:hypothetical protein